VLTLLQTGKRDMVPVVLLDAPGGSYWRRLDEFIKEELLDGGMISAHDLRLYKVTEDCDEAVQEVLQFFRVYHSMRYVHDNLVLRLNHRLSDELLAELNTDYSDMLHSGEIRQMAALPEEQNEPELEDKPRLVFHFNRRSLGKLRIMIDRINEAPVG